MTELRPDRAEQFEQITGALETLSSAPLPAEKRKALTETLMPLLDEINEARKDIDDVLNMRVKGVSDEETAKALAAHEKSIENLGNVFSELAEALRKRSAEIQKYL